MPFCYEDQIWVESPTTTDANSFFHAVFGHRKTVDEPYTDELASFHRSNWQTFLSFYEPRPRSAFLKDTLQKLFKDRDWTLENDDDFKKYVESVEEDRQVLLDELPVIASLDNVKLVLFENEATPKVIEPCSEALADYPLVTTRPMTTVVVVFRDSAYSRLTSRDLKSIYTKKEGRRFMKANSSLGGIWYQLNLLKIALLKALKEPEFRRLSYENMRTRHFDDLVLECSNSTYLLQAKWRNRKVLTADLLDNQRHRDFSLAKYFFSYQELKYVFSNPNAMLCTNAKIEFDWLEEFVESRSMTDRDWLFFEGCGSLSHRFKEEAVPVFLEKFAEYRFTTSEGQLTEANVKNFLDHFRIISAYPGGKNFERAIEDELVRKGLCEKHEKTDYYRSLSAKIIEWYDQRSSPYMTPLRANAIFSGLRSEKLLAKLHNLQLSLKPGALHFAASKRICHIIPRNDFTLSLVKLCGSLANYESMTLFLSSTESAQNQLRMAKAFQFKQYLYLVIYKTSSAKNEQDLCDIIARTISTIGDKKVMLIAEEKDELARLFKKRDEDDFEALDDHVTFMDLTEESQEQLMDKFEALIEASL